MTKVAIIGCGFLGTTLKKENADWNLIKFSTLQSGDIENIDDIDFPELKDYDVIINTAAQTDTRLCESPEFEDIMSSFLINCVFPKSVSNYCKRHGKKYVHISTACVYREQYPDGGNSFGREIDCTDPTTTYALQKFYAEKVINPEDLIVRGRLFFGETESKSNLITKMKKFTSFGTISNSYTSVHTMSRALKHLIEIDAKGIYNVVNDGIRSLWDLASMAGLNGDRYEPKSDEYRAPNLNVDNTKLVESGFQPEHIDVEFLRCWASYEQKPKNDNTGNAGENAEPLISSSP